MIDLHCHILPDVDDGSRDIEESIQLLKEAYQNGFTDIIVTPHYMQEYYEKDKTQIKEKIEELQEINVNLYQGNEIYVCREIVDLLKDGYAVPLNETNYVLFELPMHNKIMYLNDVIFSLLSSNYKPVLAHPERYEYVQKNPEYLIELMEKGVLLQSNYASILGYYGKEAKQTIITLLQNNMIQFLGSDTHRQGTIYADMKKILEELEKYCSEETIQALTQINPGKLLKNEEIEIEVPEKIKKRNLWNIFKF